MRILRANHLGMCFGVRDAIALALDQVQRGPLTVLGELAHNEVVVSSLRAHGVEMANRIDEARTPTVMITAHGASERSILEARRRGFQVLEGTCPLVRLAHYSLARLVRDGYHPVIIGQREHVEVRGMTGDLDECDVILNPSDVERMQFHPRLGVVAQTTQPQDRVQQLVGLLREQFPAAEVRFVDTVCQPTKQRQLAAVRLAQCVDVMVVVGGARSNNTRELVSTCQRHCARVHHVQDAEGARPEWLAGAETVGLTAGTSTPDAVIEAVEQRLRQLAEAPVAETSPWAADAWSPGEPSAAEWANRTLAGNYREPVKL